MSIFEQAPPGALIGVGADLPLEKLETGIAVTLEETLDEKWSVRCRRVRPFTVS
jgi:hypothetical protein